MAMTQTSYRRDTGLIAIYHHKSVARSKTLSNVDPFISSRNDSTDVCFFSSWGRIMEYSSDYEFGAHYLTPLNQQFKLAIVLERSIPIPFSATIAAVFAEMLLRMGQGSSLILQSTEKRKESERWIPVNELNTLLPSADLVIRPAGKKGWLKMSWSDGLEQDAKSLRCTYTSLSRNLQEFRQVLEATGHCSASPTESYYDSVENAFCYSMHWALHTRSTIEQMLHQFSYKGSMKGIDVGGSYGFLACELASQGHYVTNLELLEWRVKEVLPWLVQTTGNEGRVEGIAKRMEAMGNEAQSLDFVCFMGSLLCIDRNNVPGVLASAVKMLKPGGFIFIRENLELQPATTPTQRSKKFTPEELDSALQTVGGQILYYDHLGKPRTFQEVKKLLTIFVGVKISGEAT